MYKRTEAYIPLFIIIFSFFLLSQIFFDAIRADITYICYICTYMFNIFFLVLPPIMRIEVQIRKYSLYLVISKFTFE